MKKRFIIEKTIFMIYLVICISICFSLTIKPVQAAVTGCCLETNAGEVCIETSQPECKGNFSPFTPCNAKPECSDFICCEKETSSEHNCYANTLRATCQNQEGIIHSDKTCSTINDCIPGCCIIGTQYRFTTEKYCSQLSNLFPSSPKQFKPEIATEEQCYDLKNTQTDGCCLSTIEYTTQSECPEDFYPNQFCSDVTDLCERHSYKDCHDNNIYWFDSCGNKEELAQDCNYAQTGNLCKKDKNEVYCYDLSCKDTFKYSDPKFDYLNLGKQRQNGDAWCVYESPTGSFRDRPGSRHYIHSCKNGEEIIEPCRDYREEICIETTESGLSYATCITNENTSITQVPQGFDFWNPEPNEDTCAKASFDCKIVYIKKHGLDNWDLYHSESAQCNAGDFRIGIAEYCKSLGDCGMDYNIEDDFSSNGFFWTWTGDKRKVGSRPKFPTNFETADQSDELIKQTYIKWQEYGIFSGITELSQALTKSIEQPLKTDLSAGKPKTFDWGIAGTSMGLGISLGIVPFLVGGYLQANILIGLISMPVYGWIILAVALIIGGILSATGGEKSKTIHFNCLPWQAPTKNKCELCTDKEKLNKLSFETCTEYRCKSLGATCEYDDSSGTPVCFDSNPYDITAPKIIPLFTNQDYQISEFSTGYKINQKISPYKPLQIGIQTDKYATCRYSNEPNQIYEQMENYFENSYRKKQHLINISLQGGKQFNYYIRCESRNGIINQIDYIIQLETSAEPDLTPPIIQRANPLDYAPIKSDKTQEQISLYLNEPANCTWGLTSTSQKNPMICDNEFNQNTHEYECTTALPVNKGINTYYFTCTDLNNNKNTQPYTHHLIGSQPLQITSKQPQGKLLYNDITLMITTSENAECQYSISNFPYDKFINTGATQHTHPQTNLQKNKYTYKIKCTDKAGNTAQEKIIFEITADTEPPKLLYTYKDKKNFYIILNEESICRANNQQMTGTNSPLHSIEIIQYKYNIVCEDKNGNTISNLEIYP